MLPTRRPSLLAVVALATVSLAIGVLAAFTDGADGAASATTPTVAAPVPAPSGPAPAPVLVPPCTPAPAGTAPAAAPVPQALLDAFGVLRRDRTDADALPDEALRSLRTRGLEPFDPAAARLLRTTAEGGKAWVVPVRDTAVTFPVADCSAVVVPRPLPPGTLRRLQTRRRRAATGRLGAPRALPVPPLVRVVPRAQADPRPGLAVVALGGAPAGGGGALADLVRGRSPVDSDPCGGPDRDMLTVSGIVPDGVPAAFLTSPDGTAVRADVKDNAYAFVVPRPKRPEQRYVVWTGGDGTPHVAPVGATFLPARMRCATPVREVPRVTPEAAAGCAALGRAVFALPAPRTGQPPAPTPVPAPTTAAITPCAVPAIPLLVAPVRPPRAVPAPAPPVAPKPRRHR